MRGRDHYQTLDPNAAAEPNGAERVEARRENLKVEHSEAALPRDAPRDHEGEWNAVEAEKIRELDAEVAAGRISASEKMRELKLFDQEYQAKMAQIDLEEARKIAAEARAREDAQQVREHERGGRGR